MKKTTYLLILLLGLLFGACSDNESSWEDGTGYLTLSGSVVMDGEPVNAAAVLLTPGGGTYLTGSDGIFTFYDIPSGSYEIKVYKEGCQPFNKSLTINKSQQNIALTVTENTGNLHLNKGYIDMGSNDGNNVGAFTITNNGQNELTWQATWGARWITKMEPANGKIPAGGSVAVSFTISRDRLSNNTFNNHTGIIVRSTTDGNGSLGELLVTVFGQGNGTNLVNDNSDLDYIIVGDLYVQTVDNSGSNVDLNSAIRLCSNSIKGGYNDWRLPTIDELATMYENRTAIGGFTTDYYWSHDGSSSGYQDIMRFSDGYIYTRDYTKHRVRAVRKDPVDRLPVVSSSDPTTSGTSVTLKGKIEDEGLPKYSEKGFIISDQPVPTFNNGTKYVVDGQTSSDFQYILGDLQLQKTYYYVAYATNALGTAYSEPKKYTHHHELYYFIPELHLMVQRQDLGKAGTYSLAVSFCMQSRIGGFSDWRLPTLGELQNIYQYMAKYDLKFSNPSSYRWSSTPYSNNDYYIFIFTNKTSNSYYYESYVQAVRTANQ